MREGRIAQYGPPEEIFEKPSSVYVARLVGMENILDGRVVSRNGTTARIDLGFTEVRIEAAPPEETVKVGLHGEHIRLSRAGGGLRGTVTDVRYLGEATRCQVRVGATTLIANVSPREVVRAGDEVALDIEENSWIGLRP